MNTQHFLNFSLVSFEMFNDKVSNTRVRTVMASINYSLNSITVHDPFNRRSLILPMDIYNDFEGDLRDFLSDVCVNSHKYISKHIG